MKKFEDFIEDYLKHRPVFHAFIRPQEAILFQKHQKLIKSPTLDLGCGDGFFAKIVFGKNKIDVGLDLKNSRAKEAEKEKIYKKISYYNGVSIPYPDNYFKSIISNCVLEHILNLDQSLKEIYRVLKPGGYFLTTVMTDKWEDYLIGGKIFGKTYKNFMRKIQQHHHLLTNKQWLNKFNKNGFKIIKTFGYMSQNNSQVSELFHYLSIGSLINYRLTKNWVLFPRLSFLWKKFIPKNYFSINPNQSAALFFVLCKIKNDRS